MRVGCSARALRDALAAAGEEGILNCLRSREHSDADQDLWSWFPSALNLTFYDQCRRIRRIRFAWRLFQLRTEHGRSGGAGREHASRLGKDRDTLTAAGNIVRRVRWSLERRALLLSVNPDLSAEIEAEGRAASARWISARSAR